MYYFPLGAVRTTVTVNHGTTIAGTSLASTSVAVASAQVGDRPVVTPIAAPAASIMVQPGRQVTTAGQVVIDIANISTASVAPGTAATYNITLLRGG